MRMILSKGKKNIFVAVIIALVASILSIVVSAAASGTHTPVEGVTVSVSGATDNSMSSGAVTVTAKGSGGFLGIGASAKTATITIYNDSTDEATLAFEWTATSVNQLNIDGTVYTGATGSFSKLLDAGASFTVTITTAKNSTTNELVMSNFSLTVAADSSKVTIDYDSTLGSVTAGGEVVASGGSKDATLADGIALVATPVSGATFLGWVDTNSHRRISSESSYTLKPAADTTVKAAFASVGSKAWFVVDGAYWTDDLTTAVGLGSTIVLAADGTLPAGNYTIPSGDTLLVPYNDDNTLITDNMGSHVSDTTSKDASSSTLYRQLTMANGVNIAVNGAISIGSQASKQMAGQVGPYGSIVMMNGSNITVESGANLYAYGYIFYGDDTGGTVTVKSGGTVYECAFAMDYPGSASNVQTLYNNQVFPMRAFTIRNVEVPMTFHSGAEEKAFYCIYGSSIGTYPGYFQLVGNTSSAPFCLKTNATLTKSYKNSRQKLVISGTTELNSISMTLKTGLLGNYPVTSASTSGFPVPSGFEIELSSGSLTLNDNVILLEGSKLTVAKGANLYTAGCNLYVLDAGDDDGPWPNTGKDVHGVQYTTLAIDAVLDINGTVTIDGGGLYTSAGNACVQSSGGTGKIVFDGANVTDVTLSYRYGSYAQYETLTMTSASLQHADGKTYLETSDCEGSETYNYCNVHGGKWVKGDVKLTVNRVEPACEATGAEEKTCTCGYSNTVTIAALGHSSVTDAAVAPTCTETGLTEGKHCDRCKVVFVAQESVAALGHVWNWGAWSSAEKGQKCICTCGNDASHTITVLLAYRMDSYIWLNATVSSTVGTPVCNEMTLQADKYLVQKVLSNHITDSVCVSFQVDEFGKTNKLEIGFLEYAKSLSAAANTTDETVELLASMLMYGEASEDYFGNGEDATGNDNGTILTAYQENLLNNTAIPERLETALRACALSGHSADKNLLKPADTNANYGEKGLENGLTISTTGAAFYFDEALRLSVGYKFAEGATVNADGTITFGDTTYTVLQVGLLVQELKDWTMCNVLYAEEGVTAYIAYDNSAKIDPTGPENHPEVGEGGPDAFVNTLGVSGEINFDLLVKEYNKGFALRTYAVLEVNGTQYVIYGKQYGYGLEAYVKATYDVDTAFDPLLATAWGYAQAAAARYPEVK